MNNEILESVLERCRQAGLPDINVSPCQGQLLAILTKISKAKRVLEIGTLAGYSTIWFARPLPSDGMILSIELMEDYAKLARENLTLARVERKAMVICGDAGMVMERLIDDGVEPFDLIFIDADKPSNPIYLALAAKLSRSGTVIISDNVVRDGAVAVDDTADPKVIGIRRYCIAPRGQATRWRRRDGCLPFWLRSGIHADEPHGGLSILRCSLLFKMLT